MRARSAALGRRVSGAFDRPRVGQPGDHGEQRLEVDRLGQVRRHARCAHPVGQARRWCRP